jgi:hypothetical protein
MFARPHVSYSALLSGFRIVVAIGMDYVFNGCLVNTFSVVQI